MLTKEELIESLLENVILKANLLDSSVTARHKERDMMQRYRKPNHRKMLKPKFDSSSSDDDTCMEGIAPLKWKPIVATFPIESNNPSKSIQSNPIIDCLNSQTAKQQKLSAEVIQKEEIYNQAELEANKIMFGSKYPGRCLTKDEVRSRKDVILHIVNERLRSKLSQLMGEFGERIEMSDSDSDVTDTLKLVAKRIRSPEDNDSLPEAPPPPTFDSSPSSADELDLSITKQFELYEKEIKGKRPNVIPAVKHQSSALQNVPTINSNEIPTATVIASAITYNSLQICQPNSIPAQQSNISTVSELNTDARQNWNYQHETSSNNYQQNWQQPHLPIQQWTGQSLDLTPWIPPVGPPQVMEPFPPPIGAERMGPNQHIPTFPHPHQSGWVPPVQNFSSVPPYPPPQWNKSQSTPFNGRLSYPPFQYAQRPVGQRMKADYRSSGPHARSRVPYTEIRKIRPGMIPARPQIYRPVSNVNIPLVSKSTYVNAILAADQQLASTLLNQNNKIKSNQPVNNGTMDEKWNQLKNNEQLEENARPLKRSYDPSSVFDIEVDSVKSLEEQNCKQHTNERAKEYCKSLCTAKKSRLEGESDAPRLLPRNHVSDMKTINNNRRSASSEHRPKSRSENRSSKERKYTVNPKTLKKSPDAAARNEKSNADTSKAFSKYLKSENVTSKSSSDINSELEQPMEWIKLCNIVDKLLNLYPGTVKNLSPMDQRIKERNEILMMLSDDPSKFFSYADKYGEHNVTWSVKLAQRILFPHGRYDERIAAALAPFRNAIKVPKEWVKLCEIVDKLLDIRSSVVDSDPLFDSRIKERNELLMILSKDPEDLLLFDDKYGSANVNWVILAAKRILCPDGVEDERVKRLMLRQCEMLFSGQGAPHSSRKSVEKKSANTNTVIPSNKRSKSRTDPKTFDHRFRSKNNSDNVPTKWNELCEIVDKVLDTPYDVRIKLSKKDPRWEQRDNILLILSEDPDKFALQSEEYGAEIVNRAIKSAKKLIFPNGPKDQKIVKKLAFQRNTLLRERRTKCEDHTPTKASKVNQIIKEDTSPQGDKVIKYVKVPKVAVDTLPKQDKVLTKDKLPVDTLSKKEEVIVKDKSSKKDKVIEKKLRKNDQVPKKQENIITNQPVNVDLQATNGEQEAPKVSEITANVIPIVDIEIDPTKVWSKLCNIVDKLLDLPPDAADKLPSSDKRLNERNDILMILSDEPDNFSKFDVNYGSENVSWAIKSAKKLIYKNGVPNERVMDVLWKERDSIMCSNENTKQDSKEEPTKNESPEWIHIRNIATNAFQHSIKNIAKDKRSSKELLYQRIELLLQLSDDPNIVRTKPICKKIGEGRLEVAIAKCKHILNRMHKADPKGLFNFEYHRSRMVLYLESQNQSKNIKNYNAILEKVRKIVDEKLFYEIFGDDFNKWNKQQKLERNELAILMIKDPTLLKSNAKYLEMVLRTENGATDDIIADIKKCLLDCEFVKEKSDESKDVCDAPILVKIKDETNKMSPFKERKLTQRIHRLIEQFLKPPKPEVFEIRTDESDGTIDIVCANLMTFQWLKRSIKEFDGLWAGAKLKIVRTPVKRPIAINDLKPIKMTFKTLPIETFQQIMKQLKKSNSKLNTERWRLATSNSTVIKKKLFVKVDLESLIELERSKRTVHVDSGPIYFDIKYIGTENFATKY